ncbi:MAG: glycosyltransferase family 2 protein [Lachnospiraceae bacterium]|jgi:glycosyltransferase involved in cell wall biosynthesis|nr:glycosyltransferase family 2 protein [Lachnospiraceae bacterium]
MAKISVIVPIYNVEPYIRRCLDSILRQTFQDFEVLCVNDCTPDGSMEIVDEFIERYPGKVRRLDNEKNIGLGASRDRGMQSASGQYLVFFDSDDYVKGDFLEIYIRELERTGADIAVGGYIRVSGRQEAVIAMKDTPDTPWLYPAVWMRMYRRSFLQEHGLDFRGIRTYEDNPFNYRCLLEGARITVIDYCGYYYVCNPSSITRTQNGTQKYQRFVGNFREVYKEYCKTQAFVLHKDLLEYVYFSAILSCLLLQCHHAGKGAAYQMHKDFKIQMHRMFPGYLRNKRIGLGKEKEEQKKVRYAASVYRMAERMKLDGLLIRLLSF